MKKILPAILLAIATAGASQPAFAHGATQPKHGGIVSMSGETLFELVNAPTGIQLFVVDDDEPVVATAMTAKLSLDAGGKTQNIMLKPAAGNRFDGPVLKLKPGAKLGVLVIDKTSQAHLGTTFIIK
ncbi:hypothetical protein SAMN05444678_11137 [Sphingomonas sp. YR710]|jgi:hypothetical protein|uniref:hypothetical protein n=1 Tax=Sphingomonas sp. YR710 TaxID=1882773 RepID=UPI00088774CF|nr:hypothetical protein [Sphingomonas sp. YR710]SDD26705.1 hypothetical protein SAMN05444678_11137 [Sphingomonas sp. YR710]